MIVIIALASALRLYDLSIVPLGLYYDEITTVYFPYLYSQGEMPLHPISLLVQFISGKSCIYALSGPSAFWDRFPSVVYGVLFVAVCWALAKRLYGTRVGIIASFLAVVVPWSFHFSRYGVTTLTSYVFYVTLAVYLLVVYFQTGKDKFKCAALLFMAISFYTHAMALIFSFLFFPVLFIAGLASNRTKPSEILVDVLLFSAILLVVASPFLTSYLSPVVQFPFTRYTTVEQSQSVGQFIEKVILRASLHLSPDFLMLSGGKSFASSSGSFSELVTFDSLYYYATAGKVGMLNVYGIFIYLGFIWLMYKTAKTKKIDFKTFLLSWWIASYAIASGFAYYDNPNPARNIIGLPAFVLVISLVISKIWMELFKPEEGYIIKWNFRRQSTVKVLKAILIIALMVPSILYFHTYFVTYGSSYNYFDYDYKLLSNYLTRNKLWSNIIVINEARPDKWYGKTVLSFYNHSASKNIFMGDLSTAISLLASENSTVVYVSRDRSNPTNLLSFVHSTHLSIIDYPNDTPVFLVRELIGFKEKLLMDDDLANRWTPIHGTLRGERGSTVVYDEDSIVKSGSNSLKIVLTSGSWDWSGIQHNFEPAMNWSDVTAVSFEWYGSESETTIQFFIACEGGDYYYSFIDDFQGWHKFVVFFSDMQEKGLPLLSKVNSLTFAFWQAAETIVYLDKITLI